MRTSLLLVVTLLGLGAPALGQSVERYNNRAIGFSMALPAERFVVEQESETRLTLREINGAAQLEIFGMRSEERLTLAEFQKAVEAADSKRRITYRAAGSNWFVLSGYLDDEPRPTIFYAKFMLNGAGTALSAFEISYPRADKAEWDATVTALEASLTAPR